MVAATVMAAMRVATGNWLARGGEGDLPATVAAALDLLDGGCRPPRPCPPAGARRPGWPGGPRPADGRRREITALPACDWPFTLR